MEQAVVDFAGLVHLTADPAFAVGPEQRVVAANEAASQLLGEPASAVLGRTCAEVVAAFHPGGERLCSTVDCPVYQSMLRGEPVALGWSDWATPDGTLIPITGTVLTAASASAGDPSDTVAVIIVHVRAGAADARRFRVETLGAARLSTEDAPVPIPRRRRVVELLVYLALRGTRGATREQLLEDFWPDSFEADSAPRLRVLMHAARAVLQDAGVGDALERRGAVYVLDTQRVSLDALEFEALARGVLRTDPAAIDGAVLDRALAMYGGDLGASEHFGPWAEAEVQRFRRLYHDLLRRAAQYHAALGAIDRSVACCEMAIRSDPLQEQFQVALITYYGRLGRREDALRQYEDYRGMLASQVGGVPQAAAVRALRDALGHQS